MYKYKEIILIKDRDIFYECPEQHIEAHRSTRQVYNWISMVKPVLKQSAAEFKKRVKTKNISSYFKQSKIVKRRRKMKTRSLRGCILKHRQLFLTAQETNNMLCTSNHCGSKSTKLTSKQIQPEIPWKKRRSLV